MSAAKNLRDLMLIRGHNRKIINRFSDEQGTALGFRTKKGKRTSEPAVIIFVQRKINEKWLPKHKRIPKKLMGPGSLECPLDVVEVAFPEFQNEEPDNFDEISMRLRGNDSKINIGAQLTASRPAYVDPYEFFETRGTLAGLVKDRTNNNFGFLTNAHVALNDAEIFFPDFGTTSLGFMERAVMQTPIENYFGTQFKEKDTYIKVDAAFVKIKNPKITHMDLSTKILTSGSLGPVKDISLNNMDIIGTEVCRIGRTTGIRHGIIWAFGFESMDFENETEYTDLMIVGNQGKPFSAPGDSGSLIFTKEGLNPIGLLWGGLQARRRKGSGIEDWTYGAGLKRVLDVLQLEFLTKVPKKLR
jgi:hypothetical protein